MTRSIVFNAMHKMLRDAMDTGAADRIGLAREFIIAVPTAGATTGRTPRRPFPDEVARALADETNLRQLAEVYDPQDRGLRYIWDITVTTGRRIGEVLQVRWDCLGRYGGLPMFWHDQTKVGNYDAAIRIPERLHDVIAERQRKTLDRFFAQHGHRPAGEDAPGWRCSRPPTATMTAPSRLPTSGSTAGSATGSPNSTSATACRIRPGTPWPPTCCAPAPALPTSVDIWARSATAWPNTMCTCRIRTWRMCCSRSGLPGPAPPTPANFSPVTPPR